MFRGRGGRLVPVALSLLGAAALGSLLVRCETPAQLPPAAPGFGPLPFQVEGQGALPEPPPRHNPFADPEVAEQDRVASQEAGIGLLEESRARATYLMRQENGPEALHGALALLEYAERQPDAEVSLVQCLERFAREDWSRKPKETTRQMIGRRLGLAGLSEAEPALGVGRRSNGLAQLRRQYEEQSGAAWPFDWRSREEPWVDFVERFVAAQDSGEPLQYWRQQIEGHPADAERLRYCFLAALSVQTDAALDLAPLAPWLDPQQAPTRANLLRAGELFRVVVSRRDEAESPQRRQVRDVFLTLLERTPLAGEVFGHPLGDIVTEVCQSDPAESHRVLDAVLRGKTPQMFREWATELSLDRGQIHQRFLSRRIAVDYRDRPLADVLRELAALVVLPLWIDDEAAATKTRLTLKIEGAWIEVVDRVLEATPFRLQRLRLEVLWIGRPERRRAAESLLAEAVASTVAESAGNPLPLVDPLDLEVKSEPIRDVLDRASESLSVPLLWLGVGDEPILTADYRDLPACLVLAFLARDARAEVANVGGMIVLGPGEKLARLHHRHETFLRKRVVLARRNDPLGKLLVEPTGIDLSEYPLDEILQGFPREEGMQMALTVDGRRKLNPFRQMKYAYLSDATLAWGAELIAFEFGLEWESDSQSLQFVEPAATAQVRARNATRDARRRRYPAALTATLATPQNESFEERSLAQMCREWSAACELPIACDPALADRKVTAIWVNVSADVSFDLVAASLGIDWEIVDNSRVLFRPRGVQP